MNFNELKIKPNCRTKVIELLNAIFEEPVYLESTKRGHYCSFKQELQCSVSNSVHNEGFVTFRVNGNVVELIDIGEEILFKDLILNVTFRPLGNRCLGLRFHQLLDFVDVKIYSIDDTSSWNEYLKDVSKAEVTWSHDEERAICPDMDNQEHDAKSEIYELCRKGVLLTVVGCCWKGYIPDELPGSAHTTPLGDFGTAYLLRCGEDMEGKVSFYLDEKMKRTKFCELTENGMVECSIGSITTKFKIKDDSTREKLLTLLELLKVEMVDDNRMLFARDKRLSGHMVKVIESSNGKTFPGGIGAVYCLWLDDTGEQLWLMKKGIPLVKCRGKLTVKYANGTPYYTNYYIEHVDIKEHETYYFKLI